jgi:hypothetical protein
VFGSKVVAQLVCHDHEVPLVEFSEEGPRDAVAVGLRGVQAAQVRNPTPETPSGETVDEVDVVRKSLALDDIQVISSTGRLSDVGLSQVDADDLQVEPQGVVDVTIDDCNKFNCILRGTIFPQSVRHVLVQVEVEVNVDESRGEKLSPALCGGQLGFVVKPLLGSCLCLGSFLVQTRQVPFQVFLVQTRNVLALGCNPSRANASVNTGCAKHEDDQLASFTSFTLNDGSGEVHHFPVDQDSVCNWYNVPNTNGEVTKMQNFCVLLKFRLR